MRKYGMFAALIAAMLSAATMALAQDEQPRRRLPRPQVSSGWPQPIELPEAAAAAKGGEIATAMNTFGEKLYEQLKQKQGNIVFSPYSIDAVMLMAYGGAGGDTKTEMAAALQLPLIMPPGDDAGDETAIHKAFSELAKAVNGREQQDNGERQKQRGFELVSPNAMWMQKDYDFRKEYIGLIKQNYGATLEEMDFSNDPDAAVKAINDWVSNQTQERIKELVNAGVITPLTRLVLTNAIYFKAEWQSQFTKEATRPQDFTLPDGNKMKTPMMNQTARYRYGRDEEQKISWIIMPYKGGEVYMVVILPDQADGLAAAEKALNAKMLARIAKESEPKRVELSLPKFNFSFDAGLKEPLQAMGIRRAFSPDEADFSAISTSRPPLYITAVVHKAMIIVDEKGTEAAAATAAIFGLKSAPADEPIVFRADHPFAFAICHQPTGAMLFAGRVVKPDEAKDDAGGEAKKEDAGDDGDGENVVPGSRRLPPGLQRRLQGN